MSTRSARLSTAFILAAALTYPVRAQWKPAGEFQLDLDNFHTLAVVGSTLFAGSGAGVSRTQDGGESWSFAGNGMTSTDVQAFATLGAAIFVGTHGGVFRSSDNGDNWAKLNNGLSDTYIQALAAVGTDLFAATNSDICRSRDAGNNWSRLDVGIPPAHSQAMIAKGDTLFAATMNDVYRSVNHGDSWTQAAIRKPGPFTSGIGDIRAFAVSGDFLFAASAGNGVYRTADYGDTWTQLNSGLTDTRVYSLAIKAGVLYAGTYNEGVFRSADYGASWIPAGNPESPGSGNLGAVYALAAKDTELYAATSGTFGGDVLRSKDNGFNWTSLRGKLKLLGAKEIGPLIVSGSHLLTHDGKTVFRSFDGGSSWGSADKGLPGGTILSLSGIGPNLQAMTPDGLYLSSNQGASWFKALRQPAFTQILALAANDTICHAATSNGLFRSADNGSSWQASGFADTSLWLLAVDGPHMVTAGYSAASGLYRSSDQGRSWKPVASGLPDAHPRFLVVHRSVFFIGTENSGLYASRDRGVTWSKVDIGVAANLAALVAHDSSLFLGTDAGVFQSNDAGDTWKPASKGLLPGASVTNLAVTGTHLIASISNDVLWNRPRAEMPSPISPPAWRRAKTGLEAIPGNRLRAGATVRFTIPRSGYVNLSAYGLNGKKAAALSSGEMSQGVHQAGIDAAGLAPGLYVLRLSAPGLSETQRFYLER